MLGREQIERVSEYVWEIPKAFREDMRVPARPYADEDLLDAALADDSVVQLVNTATLSGVIKHAIAMPDIHQGYGFPTGGVVATRLPEEAPAAYKEVSRVVEAVHKLGIGRKIARLEPVAVIKG